jgi:hypothetical protein
LIRRGDLYGRPPSDGNYSNFSNNDYKTIRYCFD